MAVSWRIPAAVVGLGLLIGLGYGGGELYRRASAWLFPEVAEWAQVEPGCDLHRGPCTARLEQGGEISLSITPRPIPALAPLSVELRTSGLRADSATLQISGESMNMGLFRSALKAAGDGIWRGQSGLPACTTSRMDWRAELRLDTADGVVAAAFVFTIER